MYPKPAGRWPGSPPVFVMRARTNVRSKQGPIDIKEEWSWGKNIRPARHTCLVHVVPEHLLRVQA